MGVQIKGTAVRRNFEVLEELYGAAAAARVVARLSRVFRESWQSGAVTHGGWFPIEWLNEFYRAVAAELPAELDAPEVMSRRSVELDMQGIYSFLARFITPEFCIRQAPRVLGTYYKGPVIQVAMISPGYAQMDFSGCDGFGRHLWRDVVAGAQRVFEQAGAKHVRMAFRSGGREGDATARVDVHWQ